MGLLLSHVMTCSRCTPIWDKRLLISAATLALFWRWLGLRVAAPSTTPAGCLIHVRICEWGGVILYWGMHIHTHTLSDQLFTRAVTAAVTSIMVEAREASNTFNSSMPHVGTFSLDGSSSDLQIICEGVRTQTTHTYGLYNHGCPLCFACIECSDPD